MVEPAELAAHLGERLIAGRREPLPRAERPGLGPGHGRGITRDPRGGPPASCPLFAVLRMSMTVTFSVAMCGRDKPSHTSTVQVSELFVNVVSEAS